MYHGDSSHPLAPSTALATWGLAVATFFGLGLTFGGGFAVNSAAQLVALAVLPLGVVHLHGGTSLAASLRAAGLVRPTPRALAGAALAGACTWYLLLRIALPIVLAMRREEAAQDISRQVLGDGASLPLILFASALVPGICEELLHRGVVQPALTARSRHPLPRAIAVVAVALMFAVMHLEPARIAATFVLGLAAGFLALRTGSVWTAITLHVVNNAVTILVATGHADPIARFLHDHPQASLTLAILGTCGGLALATWATSTRSRQP